MKVPDILPLGIVAVVGTDADPESLARLTLMPPGGAYPLSETVPVDVNPPVTVVGLTDTLTSTGGVTVKVVVLVTVPIFAVIMATFCEATPVVFAVKLAVIELAATFTVPGTITAGLLLERLTTVPPFGARPLSVTVPAEDEPPPTLDGLTLTEPRPMGSIVSVAA